MTRYHLGGCIGKLLGIAVLCFGISACSSLPAELSVTDENSVIKDYQTFSALDGASGQHVRLGGVIATVTNLSDRTRLEMVNLPIGSDGKPDIRQEPQGRFIVYINGFLDPVTYAQGRLMTVLGSPLAPEKSQVGEFKADFPALSASAYHLWRVTERVVIHEPGSFLRDCDHWRCRDSFGSKTGQVIPEVK
ncbi:Slp family lipoprotein [Vibrio mangrovi]|uniref:Outer membrane protein slp n=1 Tax=Vibrio mangrovi TaxID=474394 RepID=A0A1Y6IPM3_9VIBR|nr:Slp family lipoprotein [Vibrio mangrovi]MDW6003612.1 Slp family lipoprotein [Vibrio mangrovi]SMR99596.1 Outer membrane protein slp precursor [Vibrio mangrovi]